MESYVYIVTLAIGLGGALWFFMNKQGSSHKTTPSSAFLATKTTIKAPMKSAVKKEKKEVSNANNLLKAKKSYRIEQILITHFPTRSYQIEKKHLLLCSLRTCE